MRWCRFKADNGVSFGIIEGDTVIAVDGSPFGDYTKTTRSYPLSSVKLDIPTVPSNFFCVGVNYADHVRRMAAKRGKEPEFPKQPDIGYRSNNALIAHDENIIKPRDAGPQFQYEGELVAVFGKTARNVSKEEALDYVLGWTIGNDVSERGWQASDRTLWRAKNSDTFKPMGPWIETDVDLDAMQTAIRVNGAVTESFKTNNMIFDAPTYISLVSKYCTIHPGDVMWMGTDGVPANIDVGDVVEIEISGIGTLRNKVVAET
ncbi:FAA hydrolase family protein [Pseudolabrys taiwanensis]|uniref:FAA hydrolase family protein n=1 Tax=Pseudolabrys taiwanensis TaxID=331696 RepID=A0A346A0L0_9HYPH|nr:fumarylacetoacetate hydrolase family protein [Pseudolabrys taiwanensis]AXK82707.1 FAA hydrolase family protein [Pseudolabrys taiwanensis]